MHSVIDSWPGAYCATQLVEIPIYLYAARNLPPVHRWLVAVGASTLTHPLVWFVFPWPDSGSPRTDFMFVFAAAEGFAILTEALWARLFHVRRPLLWSLAANAASVCAGFLIRMWW